MEQTIESAFVPRNYQQEMVERGMRKNTIVYLGTGTGKTYIAVMLIREMALPLRWSSSSSAGVDGGQMLLKKTVFIVEKVALVDQQAKEIRTHSDLRVGEYHGQKNVNYWSEEKWKNEIDDNQVLVMTAMIFVQLLNHGFIKYSQVNLLIVDECHHAASKSHPYRQLMDIYKQYVIDEDAGDNIPRILGLTATVVPSGTSEAVKVRQEIEYLEDILCSSVVTASDSLSLLKYGARPETKLLKFLNFDALSNPMCAKARRVLDEALKFCRDSQFDPELDVDPTKPFKDCLSDVTVILNTLGPWAAQVMCVQKQMELSTIETFSMTDLQQRFIEMSKTYIRAVRSILSKTEKVSSVEDLKHYLPDKVSKLLLLLEHLRPLPEAGTVGTTVETGDNEFSGILFVEQRIVAIMMQFLLDCVKRWNPENYGYIRADYVIGVSGSRSSNLNMLTQASKDTPAATAFGLEKRQQKVLKAFRKKDLNLVISTSVLEEGIDIRHCKSVIRFDHPKDFRSYVQSKGRARKPGAVVYILVAVDDLVLQSEKLHEYNEMEKILQHYIRNRTYGDSDSSTPTGDEICVNPVEADHLMRAYEVVRDGGGGTEEIKAKVSMSSAIALVNRYCSKLPSDRFTTLTPRFTITEVPGPICTPEQDRQSTTDIKQRQTPVLYKAHLVLPINSPVKEIVDSPLAMKNKKLARMAVALKVCQLLHQRGELNDRLLPVEPKESAANALLRDLLLLDGEDEGVDEADSYQKGGGRPGTAKRKQCYARRVAEPLSESLPSRAGRQECFVHVIHLSSSSSSSEEEKESRAYLNNRFEGGESRLERINHGQDLSKQKLAILSSKPLPKVPKFPLYTRDEGQIMVSFRSTTRLPTKAILSTEQISKIFRFHQAVFDDILRLENKSSMTFGTTGTDFSADKGCGAGVLIAPLLTTAPRSTLGPSNDNNQTPGCNSAVLDWEFIDRVLSQLDRIRDRLARNSGAIRGDNFQFDTRSYSTDSIVMPWYRNDDNSTEKSSYYYHVLDVCPELRPTSPFPDGQFTDYNDYFRKRYGVQIADQKQPLLEVVATTNRFNLILPRYVNRMGGQMTRRSQTSRRVKDRRREFMVPELVFLHPIPGSLWRQIVLLPTILYRLNHLLLADDFRSMVEREARFPHHCPIGVIPSDSKFEWKALDYGWNNESYDENAVNFENFCFESNQGMVENAFGPSPCCILQAFTMTSANDAINLERFEMVGDSFLKYATTVYLMTTGQGQTMHEGTLSFMRSKQVCNLNLYRLGKRKGLGGLLVGAQFEPMPNGNWLPPAYSSTVDGAYVFAEHACLRRKGTKPEQGKQNSVMETTDGIEGATIDEETAAIRQFAANKIETDHSAFSKAKRSKPAYADSSADSKSTDSSSDDSEDQQVERTSFDPDSPIVQLPPQPLSSPVHNPLTQQFIADKGIADGVEALIGTYLLTYGPLGALKFMEWLGLRVKYKINEEEQNPLLHYIANPESQLDSILKRFNLFEVERIIGYTFEQKAYLVQAFTHASYYQNNRVTDCYQRLEFLGDAVLDYMITRYLFEDKQKQHSPGELTDLRSALVNNTIFASLAVKYDFHKYFMSSSPVLHHVIRKFVDFCSENKTEANFDEELYFLNGENDVKEEEGDADIEDIEVPKCLGDIFESVAGAIYLDSGGSLNTVWSVYYRLMKDQLEKCCADPPKSPIRQLMERYPTSATFQKLRRVEGSSRVSVKVTIGGDTDNDGKGDSTRCYTGTGTSYRIAKNAAAKCALRAIRMAPSLGSS